VSALIGTTPTDWVETRLIDICTLIPGAPTYNDPQGSVPVLKPRNLMAGKLAGPTDRINVDEAAHHPRYQVQNGDLLCARTGSIGRVGLATPDQQGWIFGTGLICIRPSPQVNPQFLGLYFTHPAVGDWITRHARGTAIPSINSKILGTLPISLPPMPVQRAIGRALTVLNEKIEAHQRICETTAELRDALLPMLFLGQLSASDE
jgi:restriction endonuclease S subunit